VPRLPKIYFYKLTADNGGAPCVQHGLLSLAICKPMIRTTAERDDLIFGFAANSLHRDNRLIYIARVREKVDKGEYYREQRFADRGDRVYQWRHRFIWRPGALHHGSKDLFHDLGQPRDYKRASVLLSTDFRYFGASGTAEYKSQFPLVKDAVEQLGRGYRVRLSGPLRMQLMALKEQVWKNTSTRLVGEPTGAPRRNVCHRSRSYGVLVR
jgi:hypothetical protein